MRSNVDLEVNSVLSGGDHAAIKKHTPLDGLGVHLGSSQDLNWVFLLHTERQNLYAATAFSQFHTLIILFLVKRNQKKALFSFFFPSLFSSILINL